MKDIAVILNGANELGNYLKRIIKESFSPLLRGTYHLEISKGFDTLFECLSRGDEPFLKESENILKDIQKEIDSQLIKAKKNYFISFDLLSFRQDLADRMCEISQLSHRNDL